MRREKGETYSISRENCQWNYKQVQAVQIFMMLCEIELKLKARIMVPGFRLTVITVLNRFNGAPTIHLPLVVVTSCLLGVSCLLVVRAY